MLFVCLLWLLLPLLPPLLLIFYGHWTTNNDMTHTMNNNAPRTTHNAPPPPSPSPSQQQQQQRQQQRQQPWKITSPHAFNGAAARQATRATAAAAAVAVAVAVAASARPTAHRTILDNIGRRNQQQPAERRCRPGEPVPLGQFPERGAAAAHGHGAAAERYGARQWTQVVDAHTQTHTVKTNYTHLCTLSFVCTIGQPCVYLIRVPNAFLTL